MTASVLALLLVAAAVHAGWNLLLKRVADRYPVVWWAIAVSAVLSVPVLLVRPSLGNAGWLLAGLSAIIEAAYYWTLMRAYGPGISPSSIPSPAGRRRRCWHSGPCCCSGSAPRQPDGPALRSWRPGWSSSVCKVETGAAEARAWWAAPDPALLVALLISTYSIVDGYAVHQVDAIAFAMAIYVCTAAALAPVAWRQTGVRAMVAALRRHQSVALAVGVLQTIGYVIVLWVYAHANVSYAGAIREVSIVFGAVAGWLWLGEGFGLRRLAGATAMFVGILLIVLRG